MAYGLDHNAYYVRSTDDGATFTRPVKINPSGEVETNMGERGPKLAIGQGDSIHVIWTDAWHPGAQCYARYSRSLDGRTFSQPRALPDVTGVDGVSLTADSAGHVLVFWHMAGPPKPQVPAATWLFMERSNDNGASFLPMERVQADNNSGLACACCMTCPRVGPDGKAYLGYRGAEDNIRDMYVMAGSPAGNHFTAMRVNRDQWVLSQCPMCGPDVAFGPGGVVLCAYMAKHHVYWSIASPGAKDFSLHVATPQNADDEIYPSIAMSHRGEVLLVWQDGPLSTSGTAVAHWAIYSADGRFTGRQGSPGTASSGSKPAVFVGTDDNFYVVTTAR
jgi:hypothetical protein